MPTTKKFIIIGIAVLATAALSATVSAGQKRHHDNGHDNPGHYDDRYYNDHSKQHNKKIKRYAFVKVIEVKPIYKRVKVAYPHRVCRDDHRISPTTRELPSNSAANAVVGGIIGGVIGHQLGGGRSKDVATIAGTLLGAAIGHDNAHRTAYTGGYRSEHNERCNSQIEYRYEDRLDGYRVTYLYRGEISHTRVQRHPGDRLRIEVQMSLTDTMH